MRRALENTRVLAIPAGGRPVNQTVAEALKATLAPGAEIVAAERESELSTRSGTLRIAVADEGLAAGPANPPTDGEWLYVQLDEAGGGQLTASQPHLVYTAYTRVAEDWLEEDQSAFAQGRLGKVSFPWLTGREEFITGRIGFLKRRRERTSLADAEEVMREVARMGCSHVTVNELAQPMPYETGPDGEIYYRFYAYTPDIDQFVESKLNKGTYPREYLSANLNLLKAQAQLAERYGLRPGMWVANPRSVPESLLAKYPFLRGARVDHTFRAYRPRYTLTLAHPAVRWHYAELIRNLLREVPQLGFMSTLINDSGSGFEYTNSLYPGRNGGPYIVREWLSHDEVARLAAENVIRYYRGLRDAAHEVTPDFRVIVGLKNIAEESEHVLEGMGDGIDRQTQSQRHDADTSHWHQERETFLKKGSYIFASEVARGTEFVLGVPCPWKTRRLLEAQLEDGFDRLDLYIDSPTHAPWDVNREVVRYLQLDRARPIDEVTARAATRWVGAEKTAALVAIWRDMDRAVEKAPTAYLYGTLGFMWYRFWVRPFVPDIAAIPEEEREYYEKHMLAIFNNPHFVDFGADCLWEIHSQEESGKMVARFDTEVWGLVDAAVDGARKEAEAAAGTPAGEVFADLRDRLRAYRCYARTVRNIFAWVAGVRGYVDAQDESEKASHLEQTRQMVADELANAEELLVLWEETDVDFMPLHEAGESMNHYGANFGELVRCKIELTRKYGDQLPHIDPDFMWRMPRGSQISEEEYMGY